MDTKIGGHYYDGKVARPQTAELSLTEGVLTLLTDVLVVDVELAAVRVEARIGDMPRRVSLGAAGHFVSDDHARLDTFAAVLPERGGQDWIHYLEARWTMAAASLVVFIAVMVGSMVWGVPYLAERVAHAAPAAVSAQLASSNLAVIDRILEPSELDAARQRELEAYFRGHGEVPRILFRRGGGIGPNAFALSADAVIFTDELVHLAEDDEELLAVYFHELGHAQLKHVEISILQSSAWLVVSAVLLGDLSGASELIVSLPIVVGEAAFTRDLEREADAFAIARLKDAGVEVTKLADILERLDSYVPEREMDAGDQERIADATEDTGGGNETCPLPQETESEYQWAVDLLDYLATHPATEERAAYIRASAAE